MDLDWQLDSSESVASPAREEQSSQPPLLGRVQQQQGRRGVVEGSPTGCIVLERSIVVGSPAIGTVIAAIAGCNHIVGRCTEGNWGHSTGFGCTVGCSRIAKQEEHWDRRRQEGPCIGLVEGSSCNC